MSLFQYEKKLERLMNNSLSPIVTRKEHLLTPSEKGSDVESLPGTDNAEDGEKSMVFNSKHFSRNQRLQDDKIVNVSKQKSPRLIDENKAAAPKKASNPKLVKSSKGKQNMSSSKDTAPLGKKTSTPKVQQKKSAYLANSSLSANETSADRLRRLVGLLPEDRNQSTSSQSGRREEEPSTSKKDYGVEVSSTEWYQKQGAEYRRLQERHMKKKNEDKETSIVAAMREKTLALEKMTQAMRDKGASECSAAESAEQLWANSLVPHLARMSDEVRDSFMYTVLGMAFKAIKGTWPPPGQKGKETS